MLTEYTNKEEYIAISFVEMAILYPSAEELSFSEKRMTNKEAFKKNSKN